MAQQLRTLAVLAEDLGSILSTHIRWITNMCGHVIPVQKKHKNKELRLKIQIGSVSKLYYLLAV